MIRVKLVNTVGFEEVEYQDVGDVLSRQTDELTTIAERGVRASLEPYKQLQYERRVCAKQKKLDFYFTLMKKQCDDDEALASTSNRISVRPRMDEAMNLKQLISLANKNRPFRHERDRKGPNRENTEATNNYNADAMEQVSSFLHKFPCGKLAHLESVDQLSQISHNCHPFLLTGTAQNPGFQNHEYQYAEDQNPETEENDLSTS
ncbi:hypothetical protein M513_10531 [Trichuris suis]|uniref:Uncharacterized protein n=1 Tax=Trichuris suis TaxID=68888 RepID=A0A085LUF1_9BILA|nr:hypothetical protein M513_10531 [Trichuris suis]